MVLEDQVRKALDELRKNSEKRKFDQTLDLIINLKKFNPKKENLSLFVNIPHPVKEKKVCAFLEANNSNVDTITKADFKKYSNKNEIKKMAKAYDFFIAEASLMPAVATAFGKILGPLAKMPSPQLGILASVNDKAVKELIERVNKIVKIRSKEASLKIPLGKDSTSDNKIVENISSVYNAVLKALPKGNDNIKNIKIKFTMSKPVKILLDSASNTGGKK